MASDDDKRRAAEAALEYLQPGTVVGIGTGSTVNHFIAALAKVKSKIDGAVSSSEASSERLRAIGVPVLDLNDVGTLPLYVDGADEANRRLQLIKGGGGALTREKIVAAASDTFVCVVDRSKLVETLGAYPLPVEVVPMARGLVARELARLHGQPRLREGFVTDNGNLILDVHSLPIADPLAVEDRLNNITGIVTVGLFARRPADLLLIGDAHGVEELRL